MENKKFEDQLRERILGEELPFDSKAWDMMADKMKSSSLPPVAKVPWYKKNLFPISITVAIAVAGLIYISSQSNTQSNISQLTILSNNKSSNPLSEESPEAYQNKTESNDQNDETAIDNAAKSKQNDLETFRKSNQGQTNNNPDTDNTHSIDKSTNTLPNETADKRVDSSVNRDDNKGQSSQENFNLKSTSKNNTKSLNDEPIQDSNGLSKSNSIDQLEIEGYSIADEAIANTPQEVQEKSNSKGLDLENDVQINPTNRTTSNSNGENRSNNSSKQISLGRNQKKQDKERGLSIDFKTEGDQLSGSIDVNNEILSSLDQNEAIKRKNTTGELIQADETILDTEESSGQENSSIISEDVADRSIDIALLALMNPSVLSEFIDFDLQITPPPFITPVKSRYSLAIGTGINIEKEEFSGNANPYAFDHMFVDLDYRIGKDWHFNGRIGVERFNFTPPIRVQNIYHLTSGNFESLRYTWHIQELIYANSLIGVKWKKERSKFSVNAGLSIGHRIKTFAGLTNIDNNPNWDYGELENQVRTNNSAVQFLRKINYGISAGIQYELFYGLEADLSISQGFTDYTINEFWGEEKNRLSSIKIGIAYRFIRT